MQILSMDLADARWAKLKTLLPTSSPRTRGRPWRQAPAVLNGIHKKKIRRTRAPVLRTNQRQSDRPALLGEYVRRCQQWAAKELGQPLQERQTG
ncbi:MAG TPA: hypothetical protein VGF61_25545 [Candidatus Acidoferrum sp.]|jgi:hypothetical protein